MARWSVQWESGDNDGPSWLTVLRLAVALVVVVALVSAVAALVVAWIR